MATIYDENNKKRTLDDLVYALHILKRPQNKLGWGDAIESIEEELRSRGIDLQSTIYSTELIS